MTGLTGGLSVALGDRYRIERELGAGGMATVYLAHDLKHDRKVALKVLKPELAAVLGAERFVVEIKTTAALQHPHILPLFDSGEADGFLYYVMPFIDGETLRARLDRETQLGVDEAVRIASDVASALHYAHTHGVIHRDIKPENILLHDGRPMVADFGIALAVSAAAGGRMTETGLSLGTPHYMSPEQATAEKEISARSDIYSLGSVLYEMLSGEPPHMGNSAQQIIMKIITEPAAPVTKLRKSVPPNVAAAVAKSLEKLPADRFESAAKFAEALNNSAFSHGIALAQQTAARQAWWTGSKAAVVGITVLAVATIAAILAKKQPAAVPSMRLLIDFPEDRAPIFQPGGSFALSPDASRLVYMGGGRRAGGSGTWRLWIRPLDRLAADSIPGSERAHSPVWSPAGDSVAFVVDDELRVFSTLAGGGVATIRRGDFLGYGLSWSAKAGILFTTQTAMLRIAVSTRVVDTVVRRTNRWTSFAWPHWSAAGGAATVTLINRESLANRVLLAHVDGPARVDTLVDGFNGRLLSSGDLLWSDNHGTVFTAPVDIARGVITGGRTQLLAGVHTEPGMELRLSISETGAAVYALASAVVERSRIEIANRRTGARIVLPNPPGVRVFPDLHLSPDGRRLAVSGTRGVSHEIWLYQLANAEVEAFTVEGISSLPVWSNNGDLLTYCSLSGVSQRAADKGHPATRIAPEIACPRSWTPDGKVLLLDDQDRLKLFTLTPPDSVPVLLTKETDFEFAPAVSPDGRWLAYAATKSGTTEVWVRGFRTPGGPWPVSRGGGFDPVWSRDGRSLYFRTDSAIMVAAVSAGNAFGLGAQQRVIAASSSVSAIYGQSFDVFPDGERVVLFESGNGASVEHLILVTNLLGRTRKP